MRKLASLTIATVLALTACGSSDGGDGDAAPADPTTTTTPAETTTTAVQWTDAMQNACTSEAEGVDSILGAYYGLQNSMKPDLDDLLEKGYLNGPLTYWDLRSAELVGIGANEDGRCGGIYLP